MGLKLARAAACHPHSMISVEQAFDELLAHTKPLGTERVPLSASVGRHLAEDIHARWPVPTFDHAAMDGYAIRAAASAGHGASQPVRLEIAERIFAGSQQPSPVAEGTAAPITTGAPMPPGADAVVRQEDAEVDGAEVLIHARIEPGTNVRRRGEELEQGDLVVRGGTRIDAHVIGALAAFGYDGVTVHRRPRVAIVPTGDELHPVDQAAPDTVVDVNSPVVAALASAAGAEVRTHGIVKDEEEAMAGQFAEAADWADLVVTIGGASVGERDLVHRTWDALGAERIFHKVRLKPGKPVGLLRRHGSLILSLPGNPGAAALTFELLGVTALAAMQAAPVTRPRRYLATLSNDVHKRPGLTTFVRSVAYSTGSGIHVDVPAGQGSGRITAAIGRNAIAVLPEHQARFGAGQRIEVLLTGPLHTAPQPPALCFVGPSNSGKTTILCALIAALTRQGLRVAAMKHTSHGFQLDREGKDSHRLREAGAVAIGLASKERAATITSTSRPMSVDDLSALMPTNVDVTLVEGYKGSSMPKVEVHRRGLPCLIERGALDEAVAIVTDDPAVAPRVPHFSPNDIPALVQFVTALLHRPPKPS